MASITRVSPIRRWGGCGPRINASSPGPLEAVMGDDEVDVGAGGYDIGARARQIRDGLLSLAHPATEADMLAIQLDARALFVARWRDLLLALIDEDAMNDAPLRREFRELVSKGAAEASPDAVGYRLVRTFRSNTLNAMWRSLVTGLLGEKAMVRRASAVRGGRAGGWSMNAPRRWRRRVVVIGALSCCSAWTPPSPNC